MLRYTQNVLFSHSLSHKHTHMLILYFPLIVYLLTETPTQTNPRAKNNLFIYSYSIYNIHIVNDSKCKYTHTHTNTLEIPKKYTLYTKPLYTRSGYASPNNNNKKHARLVPYMFVHLVQRFYICIMNMILRAILCLCLTLFN